MRYEVRVVAESELPPAQGWVVAEYDQTTTLFVKPSAIAAETLAGAWAACRMLDRHHTPCRQGPPPGQRSALSVVI